MTAVHRRPPNPEPSPVEPLVGRVKWFSLPQRATRQLIAFAVLCGSVSYPPWNYTFSAQGAATVLSPAGHAWIFLPPEPRMSSPRHGVAVDYGGVVLQLLAVAGVLALVWLVWSSVAARAQRAGSQVAMTRPSTLPVPPQSPPTLASVAAGLAESLLALVWVVCAVGFVVLSVAVLSGGARGLGVGEVVPVLFACAGVGYGAFRVLIRLRG